MTARKLTTTHSMTYHRLNEEWSLATAERDSLRAENARLREALENIVKSLTLAGEPELACQNYQLEIARAALKGDK